MIILAGGDGRRLDRLSTSVAGVPSPKQYCTLNKGHSLLRLALRRALNMTSRERIVPIVTEAHRRWWEPELRWLHRSPAVVQPSDRGTGLGLLLPLLVIAKSDPDAGVLCIPSDHHVEEEDILAELMRQATAPHVLDSDKITLLGMSPNAPDPGFGYLIPFPEAGVGMRPLRQLVEKPDRASAAELVRGGGVWNTGILAGRVSQLVSLYPRHVAGLMLDLKAIVEYWPNSRFPSAELASLYSRHPDLDLSREVLAKHPDKLQFLTVPPCGWSDAGTPARLAAALWSLASHHTPDEAAGDAWGGESPTTVLRKAPYSPYGDRPLIAGASWTQHTDEK